MKKINKSVRRGDGGAAQAARRRWLIPIRLQINYNLARRPSRSESEITSLTRPLTALVFVT